MLETLGENDVRRMVVDSPEAVQDFDVPQLTPEDEVIIQEELGQLHVGEYRWMELLVAYKQAKGETEWTEDEKKRLDKIYRFYWDAPRSPDVLYKLIDTRLVLDLAKVPFDQELDDLEIADHLAHVKFKWTGSILADYLLKIKETWPNKVFSTKEDKEYLLSEIVTRAERGLPYYEIKLIYAYKILYGELPPEVTPELLQECVDYVEGSHKDLLSEGTGSWLFHCEAVYHLRELLAPKSEFRQDDQSVPLQRNF